MEPVDLNSFLETYIQDGDLELIDKLVSCSLDTGKVLQIVRTTKQYHLLKCFESALRVGHEEELIEELYGDVMRVNVQSPLLAY